MAPRRILIAASSDADRQLLKEILVQLDRRSTFLSATDGREVMRILHSFPLSTLPDLIIIEYGLPGVPADEILSHLSRVPLAPFILKVIWSVPVKLTMPERYHAAGAHLFLPNNIAVSDLKMALGNLLLSFPKGEIA